MRVTAYLVIFRFDPIPTEPGPDGQPPADYSVLTEPVAATGFPYDNPAEALGCFQGFLADPVGFRRKVEEAVFQQSGVTAEEVVDCRLTLTLVTIQK